MQCTSEELKGRMILEFMESAVYIRGIERKNVIRVHGESSVRQRN